MQRWIKTPLPLLIIVILTFSFTSGEKKFKLIGHRGGVVDSTYAENSLRALEEAYRRNYYMVEIDIRLTKDGELITQHDDHFKKYFDVEDKPSTLTWKKIKTLRNNKDGGTPLLLEEVLRYCKGKLQIMVDNKIVGNDTTSFRKIETLLRKYDLLKNALFIGTEETRQFFYHKTNTGYNRSVISELMKQPGYEPAKIFLFDHGNVLTRNDIEWARQNQIKVVPSINKFHYVNEPYMKGAKRDIEQLKSWGVEYFQIDSEFDTYLRQ